MMQVEDLKVGIAGWMDGWTDGRTGGRVERWDIPRPRPRPRRLRPNCWVNFFTLAIIN